MSRKTKIKEMRMQGYTYEQIGKEFGISKQRVHQILLVKLNNEYIKKLKGELADKEYLRKIKQLKWHLKQIDNTKEERILLDKELDLLYTEADKLVVELKS